jgi:uncharacterized surface protein with fasciclin (FAS1) repeats
MNKPMYMKKFHSLRIACIGIAGLLLILFAAKCKREPLVYTTSLNVNMTSYLDKYPEQYSEFRKILSRSETDGFLQAYGKYTLFLPTNDAVHAYLQKIGKSSVDDIDPLELKDLVTFHVIEDTVATAKFGDGKINSLTLYGLYLTTGAAVTNGQTRIMVNKQAAILKSNIRVGNGIIHVIDNVLIPEKRTLAQLIEANPDYSIFTEALKATGLYDTLNILPKDNPVAAQKFQTVLAQSNAVFQAAGFNDYAALKTRYSPGASDPKSTADSLHLLMAYHILPGARYTPDISSSFSLTTLAPSDLIDVKFDQSTKNILLNDVTFNDIYEPGALIVRNASDISAANGVLHFTGPYASSAGTTSGHVAIKFRKPMPVYWDVADFPEIRALPAIFRVPNKTKEFLKITATSRPIEGWDWPNRDAKAPAKYSAVYRTDYGSYNNSNASKVPKQFVYGDYMYLPLGIATAANPGSATNAWYQLKTPVIIKGKYKVWICYARIEQTGTWPTGRREQCQVKIDDFIMARPFDFSEPPPPGTHAELESQGWKYYTTDPVIYNSSTNKYVLVGKMVGIIDIKTTSSHTMRFDVIQGNGNTTYLDMVHFIPVDAPSQILPRFNTDGSQDFTVLP